MAKKDTEEKGSMKCEAGTVIFREGEAGDRLYIVRSGLLRLSRQVHGTEVMIDEVGPGEFCGEISLVNQQPRTCTAIAIKEAELIPLDSMQFEGMLKKNPEIALRMLKKMSERLNRAHYRLSNMALRSNKGRLLHQLHQEARHFSEKKGSSQFEPTPIPDNLAEFLAIEFGDLKQLLQEFVQDELIAIDKNGYFQILDPQAFDRYLHFLELQDRFEYRG